MIERYSRPEMRKIWTDENKFQTYLNVEILALEAFNKLGVVPEKDLDLIKSKAKFSVNRISEIEQETKHDVVAFTRCVSESLGDEAKWVHYGLTSTDVVDTANGAMIKEANNILDKDILSLMNILKEKALQFKDTPCIGRTHGVHADITSFGLKWALWYEDMKRNYERFNMARHDIEAGKISGAVGNFANAPMFVQDYVCEKLNITSSKISTQTLQRDRHAFYMSVLALIAATLEKIATEFRHLQRTEVREVEEGFSKGQKGSSAMPHKRNPISSENICGCARVMRGYMLTFYENVALWHERDISHSSTERIILPDATMLLDYMINRMINIIKNLGVFVDNMKQNIYKTHHVIFAQRVMTKLIDKGFTREKAYDYIQKYAMESWTKQIDFKDLLWNDQLVQEKLTKDEYESCFTLEYYLRNVEAIYQRIGIL